MMVFQLSLASTRTPNMSTNGQIIDRSARDDGSTAGSQELVAEVPQG